MADYWKSQPRKFCEFCKCWIADNKPSREFHEKGKKHQENVQKKIDEVMKKGRQDSADKAQMSETLQAIEKAALEALKKDLQRDPSLAAQYGVKIKKKDVDKSSKTDDKPSGQHSDSTDTSSGASSDQKKDPNLLWKEEWTPEGFVYYWNTETGESVWEKPEGYIPTWERALKEQQQGDDDIELEPITSTTDVVEQQVEQQEETENGRPNCKQEEADVKTDGQVQKPLKIQDIPLPDDENVPVTNQGTDDDDDDEASVPVPEIGPPTRPQSAKRATTSAYGEWETVKKQPDSSPVDLQLPVKKEPAPEQVRTITIEEPKIKFRQKKVDTLGAEFVAFKKRKMAASMRGNTRKTDSENV